jgi:hypothetical protein
MRNVRLFTIPVRTAFPSESQDEISIRGEGCDTPGVTIVATVFYNTPCSAIYIVYRFKFFAEVKSFI